MSKKLQLQQGDVVIEAATIPAAVTRLAHRVLREGEHTGHKHVAVVDQQIDADVALFIDEASGTLYMRVSGAEARILHEEHKPVAVPPGDYWIGAVREFDYEADEARYVAD